MRINIIVLFIIIYMLFSTEFINNCILCSKYKHISYKDILTHEIPGNYKLFNPSICKYDGGYVMCVRYSNKIIKNLFLYFHSNIDCQSHICFILLTKDMKIIKTIFPKMNSNALEDPRICYYNNYFYVSITEFINKQLIFPSLYIFDNSFNFIRKLSYNWNEYFDQTKIQPSLIQKNWCPFVYKSKLLIHTDVYPTWNVFGIKETNYKNNENEDIHCILKRKDMSLVNIISFDTTDFFKELNQKLIRCSTSWIEYSNKTFLVGLHTKEFATNKFLPTIRTILVEIDKESFIPIKKTDVLCLDIINDARIQFLSGLESNENYIYLTYGIGDYKTVIKRISKKQLKLILK